MPTVAELEKAVRDTQRQVDDLKAKANALAKRLEGVAIGVGEIDGIVSDVDSNVRRMSSIDFPNYEQWTGEMQNSALGKWGEAVLLAGGAPPTMGIDATYYYGGYLKQATDIADMMRRAQLRLRDEIEGLRVAIAQLEVVLAKLRLELEKKRIEGLQNG